MINKVTGTGSIINRSFWYIDGKIQAAEGTYLFEGFTLHLRLAACNSSAVQILMNLFAKRHKCNVGICVMIRKTD